MESTSFPQSIADVDAQFMSRVLGLPVQSATAKAGTDAVHLGQVIHVTVEYTSEASDAAESLPRELAVKLGPQAPPLKGFCSLLQALATEHRFYSEANELRTVIEESHADLTLARCFHSSVSADMSEGCVVLEWLASDTWEMFDIARGAGERESSQLVAMLASIHGSTWSSSDSGALSSLQWLLPINDMATKVIFARDVPGTVSKSLENRGDSIPEDVTALLQKMTNESVIAFFDSLAVGPDDNNSAYTLIHNDYKMENFLFEKKVENEARRVTVLDWQVARKAKAAEGAALELVAYLCRNVQVHLLQKDGFIDAVVDGYLARLAESAPGHANVPAREQFDALMRKAVVMPLITLAMTCSKWVEMDIAEDVAAKQNARQKAMFDRCLAVVSFLTK